MATPLDFVFRGYSIWLELEQHNNNNNNNDLDKALDAAAHELDVHRIPAPHVTVIYGITHLSEDDVLKRFDEVNSRVQSWPDLRVNGFKVEKSYDGIDGQEMDMAWMEVEFESSGVHEDLVDVVYDTFHHEGTRVRPWMPHVSIVYENPTMAKMNYDYAIDFMERFPTLTSVTYRPVKGISVWRTQGKMEDWKCLDRCEFIMDDEQTTTVDDELVDPAR